MKAKMKEIEAQKKQGRMPSGMGSGSYNPGASSGSYRDPVVVPQRQTESQYVILHIIFYIFIKLFLSVLQNHLQAQIVQQRKECNLELKLINQLNI